MRTRPDWLFCLYRDPSTTPLVLYQRPLSVIKAVRRMTGCRRGWRLGGVFTEASSFAGLRFRVFISFACPTSYLWPPQLSLEEGMATHSSSLVWRIPRMEEPAGLQSLRLQRVRHDWATNTYSFLLRSLSWMGCECSPQPRGERGANRTLGTEVLPTAHRPLLHMTGPPSGRQSCLQRPPQEGWQEYFEVMGDVCLSCRWWARSGCKSTCCQSACPQSSIQVLMMSSCF